MTLEVIRKKKESWETNESKSDANFAIVIIIAIAGGEGGKGEIGNTPPTIKIISRQSAEDKNVNIRISR